MTILKHLSTGVIALALCMPTVIESQAQTLANADAQQGRRPQPVLKVKGGPELWGMVEYSSAWKDMPEDEQPTGIYSFHTQQPGNMTPLLKTGTTGPNGGGVFMGDKFYYVNYSIMYETQIVAYTYTYDINTWEQTTYPQYSYYTNIIGTDLTYDPTTGNVYGYFYNPLNNDEPMRFGTISYNYGAYETDICQEDSMMICLTADDKGQLYGISWAGGFWKVDKTTGQKTLVDYTGVRATSFRQSCAYDKTSGKIYWAAFRDDYSSGLYEIEPSTGVTKLIAEIPDSMEISCLYVPEPAAADEAPAAITDLAISFVNGSNTGTVTFTMPTENYNGDAISGQLTYYIVSGTDTVATGTAEAGSKVSLELTLADGQYDLVVITSNQYGNSPASNTASQWIGYDDPLAVTDAVLTIDNDTRVATLQWTAPTGTVHDGYMDADNLTYTIIRYPGEQVVATGLKATTFTETLSPEQMTVYSYGIIAVNGTHNSEITKSNAVAVGDAFTVPYEETFESEDNYALFTVINANGDDHTWNSSYKAFAYFYSWTSAADDWVITPPIKLETGKTYKFAFDIKSGYSDTEKFSAAFGQGLDVATYTELIPTTELKNSSYQTFEKEFTVTQAGDYRFGVHAESDANKYALYVTNFRVTLAGQGDGGDEDTIDVPCPPRDVLLSETATGESLLSWSAPVDTGANGGKVDLSKITYSVYDQNGYKLDSMLTTTTWNPGIDLNTGQTVVYYMVTADNEAGSSEPASSNYVVTGPAVGLPYAESFPNGGSGTSTLWWSYGSNPYNTFAFTYDYASDTDNGSAYWYGINPGDYAYLCSGRITAAGTTHPALTFDYYATPGKDITLYALLDIEGTRVDTVFVQRFADLTGEAGWRKATVFLSQEAINARYFVLKFLAVAQDTKTNLCIDNIVIRDVKDIDMAATDIVAPSAVVAGSSINVSVTVKNEGSQTTEGCLVELLSGNEVVDTQTAGTLQFGDTQTLTMHFAPAISSGEQTVQLTARVSIAGDANADNDVTSTAVDVTIQTPDYPAVDDLAARGRNGDVNLSWTQPDDLDYTVTDNFDTYDPWLIDRVGEWTLFDGDQLPTNAFTMMNYPHIGEAFAYIVFNYENADMADSQVSAFTAHSGKQAMAAFSTVHDYSQNVPTDDWIITPELSGKAQTVSFWIKSFTDYQEDFRVYYSTDGADTASLKAHQVAFEKFGAESTWKQYSYELPAGAKHFAVCYTSNLSGILIDDFTYQGKPLEVAGYNIYRDGELIATVGADATSYHDANGNDHSVYTVTVIYTRGESGYSNEACISTSGITDINADQQGQAEYFSVDGRRVSADYPGIVIKRVNGQSFKILNK